MPSPPRRALFSLNLDTEADYVYQRVEDRNKKRDDRVKVLESRGPTTGHTQLELLTKPFERVVERTVEGVLEGTGKKARSGEGEIEYETTERNCEKEETHTHTSTEDNVGNWTVVKKTSRIGNRSSTSKKNRIWEDYDTSDL
ncbi:hypothetical protein K458DRAFT_388934 [Lentithecium fluviatile CBS 122367]|uniref:Uncharacterized protein n=1 Tax=Lentithecium fluviatile CBS 122367 TaxID=1168545 RepID=A0A6G1J2T9_9PLEO|nr:hypothetical protein K458DRAFT_388934 [Lentithecium fluviatile CBS 122367]